MGDPLTPLACQSPQVAVSPRRSPWSSETRYATPSAPWPHSTPPAAGPVARLDPMSELAGDVSRVEDWLCFAEPDAPEAEITVVAGATAAGAISLALDHAAGMAPHLYAPDGQVELAPLAIIPGDLRAGVAAVHRALLALPDARPPAGTLSALEALNRCAVRSRSDDGEILVAAARPGPVSVRLHVPAYRAYGRFARAVLADPFDRFAALGLRTPQSVLDPPASPEVGL